MKTKDIKGQPKQELQRNSEPTKPAKQFIPPVDIYEDSRAVTVVAEMPGVDKEGLEIHLEDGVLAISGTALKPDTSRETVLLNEFDFGRYIRRFTLSESIDQEKVEATIVDGILFITLPKVEPAQPRKIKVKTG
ncbi:MAG: Hsp20/alpha crystallin family protein [Desulfobacterales bacterium]|nr:Hsp20/alpha crystallin family protein [Desulfobacterales bacterium]